MRWAAFLRFVEFFDSLGCIFFGVILNLHLLYLDDSESVRNQNEKYLVLGGLSVYEAQAHWFTEQLDTLAEGIDPNNPRGVEFHASEIFARRSHPWKGMSREEAQGVIVSILKILSQSYDTAIAFACAIHKDSYPNDDPIEQAFEDLCSRFDIYLSALRSTGDRQRGLIILDKSSQETTLQQIATNFRRQDTRWGGLIRNLADTPLFVDSKAS